jgi:hypothetical protein
MSNANTSYHIIHDDICISYNFAGAANISMYELASTTLPVDLTCVVKIIRSQLAGNGSTKPDTCSRVIFHMFVTKVSPGITGDAKRNFNAWNREGSFPPIPINTLREP